MAKTTLIAGKSVEKQPRVFNHAFGMAEVFHRNTLNPLGSQEGDKIDMNDFTKVAEFQFGTIRTPIPNPISLCFHFSNSIDSAWDEHQTFQWFNPKNLTTISLRVEGATESHRSSSVGDIIKFNNGFGDFFFEISPIGFRYLSE